MNLKLIRNDFSNDSTIGELWIDNKFFCFTLEDKDRDLIQSEPLQDIAKKKLHGKTAIPYGKYDVAMTFSNRFQKYMPQILDVPGFAGIRIHSGNTHVDTEGCPLVGEVKSRDFIGHSKRAYSLLFKRISEVEKSEKITIEIVKETVT